MAGKSEPTTKFKVDISELKKGIQDAQRQIRLANAEFKSASSGMDDWASSADGIAAKLRQLDSVLGSQETVLNSLKQQYAMVAEEQGENSKGAQELAIKIANQEAAINNTKKSIDQYENALIDLDETSGDTKDSSENAAKGIKDVGDEAKDAEGKTDGLKGKLADLAKNGLAAVGTAAAGLVTAFLGSAEATRELRESAAKVDTAFTTMGFSADTASKTYEDFYAILGDSDQATEAVGNIAKLAKSEQDLADWTEIATGVYATFGDGLPIEGLAEAANETAKVAKITGPLADALNWATTDTEAWNEALGGNQEALAAFQKGVGEGMNAEDAFNEALLACNDESDRAALITSTLTSLYGDAADAYKDTAGDIMDANRAQSQLNDAMASVGAVAEPVMTTLKTMGAELLTSLLPNVEQLGQGFKDLMNGVDGAGDSIGEALSGMLTTALNKIVELAPTIIQVGLSLVSNLIQGILASLPQLVTTAIEIVNMLLQGLGTELPKIATAIIEVIPQIIESIMTMLPQFITAAIQFVTAIVEALPDIIQALIDALPTIITSIVNGLLAGIQALTQGAITLFMAILDALPEIIGALITALPDIINTIVTTLVTALPQILEAAITLFSAIMQALPTIIILLVEALPEIITTIVETLLDNLPLIMDCAIELFMALIEAIPEINKQLVNKLPEIIKTIIKELLKLMPKLLEYNNQIFALLLKFFGKIIAKAAEKGKEFVSGLVDKIKELPGKMWSKFLDAVDKVIEFGGKLKTKAEEAGKKLVKGIKDKIEDLPDDIKKIGGRLTEGLWNGINDKFDWLTGKIKSFAKNVTDKLKGFFGIHSPSRVMRDQVGKYLALGIAEGITKNKGAVNDAMESIKADIASPLDFNVGAAKNVVGSSQNGSAYGGSGNTTNSSYTFNQYNNSPKALSRLEIYRQTKNQLAFAKGV